MLNDTICKNARLRAAALHIFVNQINYCRN